MGVPRGITYRIETYLSTRVPVDEVYNKHLRIGRVCKAYELGLESNYLFIGDVNLFFFLI